MGEGEHQGLGHTAEDRMHPPQFPVIEPPEEDLLRDGVDQEQGRHRQRIEGGHFPRRGYAAREGLLPVHERRDEEHQRHKRGDRGEKMQHAPAGLLFHKLRDGIFLLNRFQGQTQKREGGAEGQKEDEEIPEGPEPRREPEEQKSRRPLHEDQPGERDHDVRQPVQIVPLHRPIPCLSLWIAGSSFPL